VLRESNLGTFWGRSNATPWVPFNASSADPIKKATYVIGLTGGIACGKSSVASMLKKLDAIVIDCDVIGQQAYTVPSNGVANECFSAIVNRFGEPVVDPASGQIDRARLGQIVFSDPAALSDLNSIVWPHIAAEVERLLSHLSGVVVVEAAVLFEAKWDKVVDRYGRKLIDEVWVVAVPVTEARRRLMDRNNLSEDAAQARIDSQLTNQDRLSKADVCLSTAFPKEKTLEFVLVAWRHLVARVELWRQLEKTRLIGYYSSKLDVENNECLLLQWESLMMGLGLNASVEQKTVTDRWLTTILDNYGGCDRHYHDLSHLHSLLKCFQNHYHRLEKPLLVLLAIWFHDLVYSVPQRNGISNEQASAQQFRQFCAETGLFCDPNNELHGEGEQVVTLISLTEEHGKKLATTVDADYFLDFDLHVLGQNASEYQRYSQGVRREYSIYSDSVYNRGRKAVLQSFLAPENAPIFRTKVFRDELEENARRNIRAEISELQSVKSDT